MKKLISIFLFISFSFSFLSSCSGVSTPYEPAQTYTLASELYLVVNLNTGVIVEQKEAERPIHIGTLTHLMVALIVSEAETGTETPYGVAITSNDASFENIAGKAFPNIDIAPKEVYTCNELLNAMLLYDAYDATNLLAQHYGGGSIADFVAKMNAKAAELSMVDTFFTSPNGLTGKDQKTTANDLYILAKEIITKHPHIMEILSKMSFETEKRPNQRPFTGANQNPFTNPEIDGGVFYYQNAKGLLYSNSSLEKIDNLIAYAVEGSEEYVGIFLKAPHSAPAAVANNIYSTESSGPESSAVESSSPESSGEESSAPVDTPPVASGKGEVFKDATNAFNYAFTNFKRVARPETNNLLTIPMLEDTYDNPSIEIGLESGLPEDTNITAFLCEVPANFPQEVQKGDVVGRAFVVGGADTPPINLIAMQSSNGSVLVNILMIFLRIIFVLIIIFIIFILVIRYRNISIQRKRKEERQIAARKAAMEGRTIQNPNPPKKKRKRR